MYSIASWVPGRLRIQAAGDKQDSLDTLGQRLKQDLPNVEIEARPRSHSLVIRYDNNVTRKAAWMSITKDLAEPGSDGLSESMWRIRSAIPGRLRVFHPLIGEFEEIASKLESALSNRLEIKQFNISSLTSSALIVFDEKAFGRSDLITFLNKAIEEVFCSELELSPDESLNRLALASSSMIISGVAHFAPAFGPVGYLAVFASSYPIIKEALHSVTHKKRVTVDILDSAVILSGMWFGYIFAAGFMAWIVTVADALRDSTYRQSKLLLTKVFGSCQSMVRMRIEGREVMTALDMVRKGDEIVVGPGEQVPIDGTIIEGECAIDQHMLTGESAPVEKEIGQRVFARTILVGGKAWIRVDETSDNTQASKIIKVLEKSLCEKVRLQSVAERFADGMVLPTFALAAVANMTAGPNGLLAVLNADFGTGIRVAAPTALLASLSYAARRGILIKNVSLLERVSKMDACIFDKTGTLTRSVPMVTRIIIVDPVMTQEQVIALAACAESPFTHPIAMAIKEKAVELGVTVPELDRAACHIGFGIEVRFSNGLLKVGSARYMQRESIAIPDSLQADLDNARKEGHTAIYVSLDSHLVGIIELASSPRNEAEGVIADLKRRGVKRIVLISGDHPAPTKKLADQLGIPEYYAEVLPVDKAKWVERIKSEGYVVGMVGDGINDAPALSKADLSFSLTGASDIATDVADIVFMDGNLDKFPVFYDIAEGLNRNIKRSFGLVIVPNSLCIAGAITGVVGFGTSLVLNNCFNMIATINGMFPFGRVMSEIDEEQQALIEMETGKQQRKED
ncbi:MAG: heavy metal translocating P-type ATPase [Candidatus Ozemobacteraceae bacterium]